MRPATAAVLLASLVALAAPNAGAQERYTPISGERLLRMCTAREGGQARECDVYISAVSDAITSYQAARPQNGSKGQPLPDYACVPGKLTGPQLRDAVVQWGRQNQGDLRQQASVIVIRALMQTFPCGRR